MLRFLDSCNHYQTSDLNLKWGIDTVDGSGAPPAIVPGGRFGGNALQLSPGGQGITKTFDNQQIWIVGFNFKTTSFGPTDQNFLLFYDGVNFKASMGTSPDGSVWFNPIGTNFSSTFQMQVDTWYYVEVMICISASIPANSCTISVNGDVVLNLPVNLNMLIASDPNLFASTISICPAYGTNNFSDIYICDGTGTTNNTVLGPTRVLCRLPNGPGSYQNWTASSIPAFECVNDPLPNHSSFIFNYYDGEDLASETFDYPDLSTTTGTIYGQQIVLYAHDQTNKGYITSCAVSEGIKNIFEMDVNLTPNFLMYPQVWETDPVTQSAWLPAAASAAEYGVQLAPNSDGYCYVTQLAIETIYNMSTSSSLGTTSTIEFGVLLSHNARASLAGTSQILFNEFALASLTSSSNVTATGTVTAHIGV
jgi:hypothetical protein